MSLQRRKIARELIRIKDQINSWFMCLYEPYYRFYYQKNLKNLINFHINEHHILTDKVAVFLIFQPQGLASSSLLTLSHLQSKGYSTLLVTNSAISPSDISIALPLCWKIMCRPNFGYDFGGYQDGIQTATDTHHSLNQLLVINDSTWFPLRTNCDLLDRMEAHPAGFVGAFQMDPTRSKHNILGKKRPFMGSFFWHFKEPVLRSAAFKIFWINYKATSSKYATVRRGERRFTHHLLDAGIKSESIYKRGQFDDWLKNQKGDDLKRALRDLCTADPDLAKEQNRLLQQNQLSKDWETKAMQLAMAITESQNIMATAPLFMVRNMGLSFIKKSTDDTNVIALRKLANHWYTQPNDIAPCVIKEIETVLRRMGH